MPNIAALIGGNRYTVDEINRSDSQPIASHIEDAYNWLTSTMNKNNFETVLVNPKWTPCSKIENTKNCAQSDQVRENLYEIYDFNPRQEVNNDVYTLAVFTIFKITPVSLKPLWYDSTFFKNTLKGNAQLILTVNSRYSEYLYIKHLSEISQIAEDTTHNKFIHIWTNTLISPFSLDSQCGPLEPQQYDMYSMDSRLNSTRCVLNALTDWFEWMKKNDVFDNTKIIMVADHGAHNYDQNWVRGAVNPIFLVKEFDQKGSIQTQRTLVQNSDVASIICSSIGGCRDISQNPILNPDKNKVARYHYTTHGNREFIKANKKFDIRKSFEITGDVWQDPRFGLETILQNEISNTPAQAQ